MSQNPEVAIIMGSDSDMPVMGEAKKILQEYGVAHVVKILSAHRSPEDAAAFAKNARKKGLKVIIAGAGGAAHLAGVVASLTTLPVIGVPMETKELKGIDSLFSIVQMPAGIPVATVTIGPAGAKNAAILAIQILSLSDKRLEKKLAALKVSLAEGVRIKNRNLAAAQIK
ncbi:MAG: 5-(carboxyamino)imidazole ribonucleotide mutase [Candidatus Omnitrophica bacterium]|nr:5-(carboxyamino)imidazole ribonucleotide mutase [Candidatus Omnitrophota bacterium]MCM8791206.1 5-(carboxyamino)imidazole ribonucleotide mutase [Candidatus Omnitrophota bacterium]